MKTLTAQHHHNHPCATTSHVNADNKAANTSVRPDLCNYVCGSMAPTRSSPSVWLHSHAYLLFISPLCDLPHPTLCHSSILPFTQLGGGAVICAALSVHTSAATHSRHAGHSRGSILPWLVTIATRRPAIELVRQLVGGLGLLHQLPSRRILRTGTMQSSQSAPGAGPRFIVLLAGT